jgi:biopolymer transport protein ExbB/TolQ
MPRKISRYDMLDAISLYFRSIGQYSPCRQNSTKAELERIIQQYNINVDAFLIQLEDMRQAEKIEREKQEEEIRLKIENIKMQVRNMTDEQREKFNESMNVLRTKYSIL